MRIYRHKINKNRLVHFKKFHCHSALLLLRKLRIQKRHFKRTLHLKRGRLFRLKHRKHRRMMKKNIIIKEDIAIDSEDQKEECTENGEKKQKEKWEL